jgi:hypothetical protein
VTYHNDPRNDYASVAIEAIDRALHRTTERREFVTALKMLDRDRLLDVIADALIATKEVGE